MFMLHLRSFGRGGNINVAEGAVKSLVLLEGDVDFERGAVVKVFVGRGGGVANDGQEVDGEDNLVFLVEEGRGTWSAVRSSRVFLDARVDDVLVGGGVTGTVDSFVTGGGGLVFIDNEATVVAHLDEDFRHVGVVDQLTKRFRVVGGLGAARHADNLAAAVFRGSHGGRDVNARSIAGLRNVRLVGEFLVDLALVHNTRLEGAVIGLLVPGREAEDGVDEVLPLNVEAFTGVVRSVASVKPTGAVGRGGVERNAQTCAHAFDAHLVASARVRVKRALHVANPIAVKDEFVTGEELGEGHRLVASRFEMVVHRRTLKNFVSAHFCFCCTLIQENYFILTLTLIPPDLSIDFCGVAECLLREDLFA